MGVGDFIIGSFLGAVVVLIVIKNTPKVNNATIHKHAGGSDGGTPWYVNPNLNPLE